MIFSFLIFNNQNNVRISKFYNKASYDERDKIIKNQLLIIQKFQDKQSNIIIDQQNQKFIIRKYANLYIILHIDNDESELGILDLIQVFVELLDKFIENVTELDIQFQPLLINQILDEIIAGGTVINTNIGEISDSIRNQLEQEKIK